jgi:diguanylate cyclase (GGDEF)-like protein
MDHHCASDEERARLAALHRYEIMDTEPQEAFDRITRLTKTVMQMPMVLVNMIDKDRQWFLSSQGVKEKEVPRRDASFCIHAIRQSEPLVVNDTLKDPRFVENPRVVGDPNVRFYIGVPLRSRDGYNIGTLCSMDIKTRQMTPDQIEIMRDFGRLVVDELELRLLANTDSLTGAMSRRYFYEESNREIGRAQRHATELSCALIDIDHFKSINDKFGHEAGDLVLKRVVATCKSELRPSDYIGRLGGEEFAVMLPNASRDAALEAVERMRKAVAALSVETPAGKIGVTVSIGLTTRAMIENSIEPALRRADVAVYKAKSGGRNRTVCCGSADEAAVVEAAA